MTYDEYCTMRERLAQIEHEYETTWQAITDKRKRSRKLASLSLEMNRLQDAVMLSPWYKQGL